MSGYYRDVFVTERGVASVWNTHPFASDSTGARDYGIQSNDKAVKGSNMLDAGPMSLWDAQNKLSSMGGGYQIVRVHRVG